MVPAFSAVKKTLNASMQRAVRELTPLESLEASWDEAAQVLTLPWYNLRLSCLYPTSRFYTGVL